MDESNIVGTASWLRDDVIDGVRVVNMVNIKQRLRATAMLKLRQMYKGDVEAASLHLRNLRATATPGGVKTFTAHNGEEVLKKEVLFQLVDPKDDSVYAKFTLWMVPND